MADDDPEMEGNRNAQAEEAEALQAIFGEDVCTASPDGTLLFQLPSKANCRLELRLAMHEAYPSTRPPLLAMSGLHVTDGAQSLAEEELLTLFCPGAPVIYDFVTWVMEQPELLPPAHEPTAELGQQMAGVRLQDGTSAAAGRDDCRPASPVAERGADAGAAAAAVGLVSGEPFTEKRSTFQAHLAPVACLADVSAALEVLLLSPKIQRATHNIRAYRIRPPDRDVIMQDCDDDGEEAAGGRLLHLLEIVGAQNVLVVVSRWYGGVLLGPARFGFINNAARTLLDACGYIQEGGSGKGPRTRVSKKDKGAK